MINTKIRKGKMHKFIFITIFIVAQVHNDVNYLAQLKSDKINITYNFSEKSKLSRKRNTGICSAKSKYFSGLQYK